MITEGRVLRKVDVLKSLEALPDDAAIEDIIEHLYFVWKIERRLKQADSGETISHEEARERMKQWRGV